ncbi:hypothetical protein EDD86DRAFT_212204 [Gorgonomyces haynaldii]|nr:hypothetical protein EDD86DRAFT_212204 [Gorgonomyces haynaldii]
MTLPWEEVLSISLSSLLEDNDSLRDEVDKITPMVLGCEVDVADPKATPENLIHLFKLAKLVLQVNYQSLNDLEHVLKERENDLDEQNREVSKLRAISIASGMEDTLGIHDALNEALKQKEQALKDLENLEEALEQERMESASLKLHLKEEQTKTASVQESNRRLEAEVKECKAQLSSQKTKVNRMPSEEVLNVQKKNQEINRYIAEIQILSTDNAHLADDLEAVTQELEAAVTQLDKNATELESNKKLLDENLNTIDELTNERDALRIRLEDMAEHQEARMNEQVRKMEKMERLLDAERQAHKDTVDALNDAEKNMTLLRKEITSLKDQLMASEMVEMKQELQEKNDLVEGLRARLKETQYDLELLAYDWDRLDRIVKNEISDEIAEEARDHSHAIKNMKDKLDAYKRNHEEDLEKTASLMNQVVEKEQEILNLQEQVQRFENGQFGLQEAMKEIKNLRMRVNADQREIKQLTIQITDLQIQASDLAEENTIIRKKYNLPDTKLDTSNLKQAHMIELEQERSLTMRLQKEIEALEDERIALKKELRLVALDRVGKGIGFGLDAEQMIMVEDFAESLKKGEQFTRTKSPAPMINTQQLDKLVLELERCHIEQQEMRDKLFGLERENQEIRESSHLLELALMEVSRRYTSSDRKHDENYEAVKQLTKALESKYQSALNLTRAHSFKQLRDTLKSASSLSLSDSHIKIDEAVRELEQLTISIGKLEEEYDEKVKELEYWKREAKIIKQDRLPIPLSLREPSEELVQNIIRQLMHTLTELEEKETKYQEMERVLEQMHQQWEPVNNKLRLLYLDHSKIKKEKLEQEKQFEKKIKSLEDNIGALSTKNNRLEKLIQDLSLNPDQMRQELIQVERRLVVLEVNEQALMRRYQASLQVESLRNKENEQLRHSLQTLEHRARATIMKLNTFRNESKDMIRVLQDKLEQSVSQSEYVILENKLKMYISKTKVLIEKERDWIDQRVTHELEEIQKEDLQDKVHRQAFEIERLKIENGELAKKADNPDLSHLKANVQVLETRAKMAEELQVQERETCKLLKKQLETVNRLYLESKDDLVKLQQEYFELSSKYEGGLARDQANALRQQVSELQELVQKGKSDVEKYKAMSDLATVQASDVLFSKTRDEKELKTLRQCVEEMQMMNDHSLIIGKLNQKIIALEQQEAQHLHQQEQWKMKESGLEATILDLENRLEAQDKFIYNLHLQNNLRIESFQKSISQMRVKLSGVIVLDAHERTCQKLSVLFGQKEKTVKENQEMKREHEQLLDEYEKLKIEAQEHQSLVDALQDQSKAQDRVLDWYQRMKKSQQQLMKQERMLQESKKRILELEETAESSTRRLEELQEYISNYENEVDAQKLEYDRQQTEAESLIAKYEMERDEIHSIAATIDIKNCLPDRSLPIGQQLEISLRMLLERTKLVKHLEQRLDETLQKLESQENLIKTKEQLSGVKDQQLAKMQLLMVQKEIQEERNDVFGVEFEEAREREQQALVFAKQTMDSMKAQLQMKDQMIQKYRNMLTSIRKQVIQEKDLEFAKLTERNLLIDDLTMREIHRFAQPENDAVHKREKFEQKINMISELEKMIAAKDLCIHQMQQEMEERERALNENISALEERLKDTEQVLQTKSQLLMEEEQKTQDLSKRLEQAGIELSKPTPPDLTDVVERLHGDLKKREGKIKSLEKVIEDLKAQLVQTAKEAAEFKYRSTMESSNIAEIVEQKTLELVQKIIQFETRAKKLSQRLDTAQVQKQVMEKDIGRLSQELLQKNHQIQVLQRELVKKPTAELPQLPKDDTNDKKYLKKINNLKELLKSQTDKEQNLLKQLQTCKDLLSKSEKEKTKMQTKITKLTLQLEELRSNQAKEHKEEIQQLKSDLNLAREQLEHETEKYKVLESIHASLKKSRQAFGEEGDSASPVAHLEQQVQDLLQKLEEAHQREQQLTDFKLDKDFQSQTREQLLQTIEQLSRQLNRSPKQTELQMENKKLKKELKESLEQMAGYKEATQATQKLEEENLKLRIQLRRDQEKHKSIGQKVKELTVAKDQMIKEIVQLRKAVNSDANPEKQSQLESRVQELEHLLKEKEKQIEQLLNPDTDEHSRLLSETRRLQREVDMWKIRSTKLSEDLAKTSLRQSDSQENVRAMEEELEDLRANYKDTMRQILLYERRYGPLTQ